MDTRNQPILLFFYTHLVIRLEQLVWVWVGAAWKTPGQDKQVRTVNNTMSRNTIWKTQCRETQWTKYNNYTWNIWNESNFFLSKDRQKKQQKNRQTVKTYTSFYNKMNTISRGKYVIGPGIELTKSKIASRSRKGAFDNNKTACLSSPFCFNTFCAIRH